MGGEERRNTYFYTRDVYHVKYVKSLGRCSDRSDRIRLGGRDNIYKAVPGDTIQVLPTYETRQVASSTQRRLTVFLNTVSRR